MLLAACGPSAEEQATMTATALTTITTTWTPTSMSTPTVVITPIPTSIPTRTASLTPTRTPIPSPTPNLAATVVGIQQPRLYASYPSPDGIWRVDIIIYDCVKTFGGYEAGGYENAYDQLRLINVATGEDKLADEQLQYCGGVGAFGLEGRFWSPNSRYFYYTDSREGIPDGDGSYWVPDFIRLDVTNLNKVYLGFGPPSPDGTKIVAIQCTRSELVVWNIDGGEIARLPAYTSDILIGPIVWSPDSRRLVYIQIESCCPASGKSYLILVDLTKPEQRLLLESEMPTFGSTSWEVAGELSLYDENGKEWRYDLLTQELTPMP